MHGHVIECCEQEFKFRRSIFAVISELEPENINMAMLLFLYLQTFLQRIFKKNLTQYFGGKNMILRFAKGKNLYFPPLNGTLIMNLKYR